MVLADYISRLLAKKCGLPIHRYPMNYTERELQCLADDILEKTGMGLSLESMQRMFFQRGDDGVRMEHILHALAIYLGYICWDDIILKFREAHKPACCDNLSCLLSIEGDMLEPGTLVLLYQENKPAPFVLQRMENGHWKFLQGESTVLKPGDEMTPKQFIVGTALCCEFFYRNGELLGSYNGYPWCSNVSISIIPPDKAKEFLQ